MWSFLDRLSIALSVTVNTALVVCLIFIVGGVL